MKRKPIQNAWAIRDSAIVEDVDQRYLKLIASNSEYGVRPRCITLRNPESRGDPATRLSVATVSTSMMFRKAYVGKVPQRGDIARNHFRPILRSRDRYQLFTIEDDLSVDQMKSFLFDAVVSTARRLKQFEDTLDRSHDGCRRMIVLNEFGFPFPMESAGRQRFLADLEREMRSDVSMRDFWSTCYLLIGSYHCHDDMRNSAVVSLPYRPRISVQTRDGENADEQQKAFYGREIKSELSDSSRFHFTQDKLFPAESIGERLVPRNNVEWVHYDTDIGRIGILICFDALDPRMLARLALLRFEMAMAHQRFAALIVPCFSDNDRVAESCELLSSMLGTLVIYVNAQYVERKQDVNIPQPGSPLESAHAYFDKGERVMPDDKTASIVSTASKAVGKFDEDRNLWYSTRFCYIDQARLLGAPLADRSPVFTEIFGGVNR